MDRLPSRSFRVPRSFRRGEVRETKVCLFLPELLWVALRRRAADRGVSALHLVRLALEALEPDWREYSLVSRLALWEGKRVRDFPQELSKEVMWQRRAREPSVDASEGVGLLLGDRDLGEVAAGAERGIRAHAGAVAMWGRRASVAILDRHINGMRLNGQASLFTAKELVG